MRKLLESKNQIYPVYSENFEILGKEYTFKIFQRRKTGTFEAFVAILGPTGDKEDSIFEFETTLEKAKFLKPDLVKYFQSTSKLK